MKNAGEAGKIHFDRTDSAYGAMVNDSPYAIRIADITWPTVTHYLLGERYPESVPAGLRVAGSVGDAWRMINSQRFAERQKWDVRQDEYVYRALVAKFTQHLDLEQLLSQTGNCELVYSAKEDSYYGTGPEGKGHNMLGRLLMRVRRNLWRLRLDYVWGEGAAEVIDYLEAAVENNRANGHAISLLAEAYCCLGWYEWAVSAARQALLASKEYEEWNFRVLAQSFTSLGRDSEAVEPLKQLIQLDPNDSNYLAWLASALESTGQEIPAKIYALRARQLEQQGQTSDDPDFEAR